MVSVSRLDGRQRRVPCAFLRRGALEAVFKRSRLVSHVEAAIFVMGTEVAEVLSAKIRNIEDTVNQAIGLAFRLGLASGALPMHQSPVSEMAKELYLLG